MEKFFELLILPSGTPTFFGRIFFSVITVLAYFIVSRIIIKLIDRSLKKKSKDENRAFYTTQTLMKKVVNIIFVFLAGVDVLNNIGVNTNSIIAAAGVGSVAIGFGAQSLVKDIITGFFILVEGQFYVGDTVKIGDITGTVLEFGIRSTKIRDFSNGTLHIVPNGTISVVNNLSRGDQLANITLDIPYEYDSGDVIRILKEVVEPLGVGNEDIISGPDVKGISAFKEKTYSIFIATTTKNGAMYETQRTLRKTIMDEFDKRNIKLEVPTIFRDGRIT